MQRSSPLHPYQQQQQQQHADVDDGEQAACRLSALTLGFQDATIEKRFISWYSTAAATHDMQAGLVYLWMVAAGSLLYLVVESCSLGSRPAHVDHCSLMILWSWLAPLAHLVMLRALPRTLYIRHRTYIILLLRACMITASALDGGFALCGVGLLQDKQSPSSSPGAALSTQLSAPSSSAPVSPDAAAAVSATAPPAESPYSALLWRSGVIGLIWWSAAFPVPFKFHLPAQAGSVALYMHTLAPAVCDTMHGVRQGRRVLSCVYALGQAITGHLLGAMGVRVMPSDVTAAAEVAGNSSAGCVRVLSFLQLVLGVVLPAYVVYCYEAYRRRNWCRDHVVDRQPSGVGIAALEAAAVAALQEGRDWGLALGGGGASVPAGSQQQDHLGTRGSSPSAHLHDPHADSTAGSSRGDTKAWRAAIIARQGGSQQPPAHAAEGRPSTAAAAGAAAGASAARVDWVAAEGVDGARLRPSSQMIGPGIADFLVLLVTVALSWVMLGQLVPEG